MLKCMRIPLAGLIDQIVQGCKSDYRKFFTICIRRDIDQALSLIKIVRTRVRFSRCELAQSVGMIFLDVMTSKRHVRHGFKIKMH
jgi:hypothetical protein